MSQRQTRMRRNQENDSGEAYCGIVKKTISSASIQQEKQISYICDGWDIVAEQTVTDGTTNTVYYIWWIDLSGTLQGAGGVGGLLATVRDDGMFFPCYDANGNVTEYVGESGTIRAHYEYSPFGEIITQSGDLAYTFTHRFSTKPWCAVTGMSEYEQRKYKACIGRWASRDPIEEEGGLNLYGFTGNNPLNKWDYLGQASCCNGKEFNRRTHCCCGGTVWERKPIDTGVRICTLFGRKIKGYSFGGAIPVHGWIEIGTTSFGFGPDKVDWPDLYGGAAQAKCTPIKLSPCLYDIEIFKADLVHQTTGRQWPYVWWLHNCMTWRDRQILKAKQAARKGGCTQ